MLIVERYTVIAENQQLPPTPAACCDEFKGAGRARRTEQDLLEEPKHKMSKLGCALCAQLWTRCLLNDVGITEAIPIAGRAALTLCKGGRDMVRLTPRAISRNTQKYTEL